MTSSKGYKEEVVLECFKELQWKYFKYVAGFLFRTSLELCVGTCAGIWISCNGIGTWSVWVSLEVASKGTHQSLEMA